MQYIARQIDCSHTAFLSRSEQADVRVRFFTHTGEIKNCGHGTIAAHVVRAMQLLGDGDHLVHQQAMSGIQAVQVERHGDQITVFLAQDEIGFHSVDQAVIAELLPILGLSASDLCAEYPMVLASPGANRFLVALNSADRLSTLQPNIPELKRLCERVNAIGCFAFTLTPSPDRINATARMFAPIIGVPEDVINGNSSGCLGAYLLTYDAASRNKSELTVAVEQGYKFGRSGTVIVKAKRVADRIETRIGGAAVIASVMQIPLA